MKNTLSLIYSQPSIEPLKNMVNEILYVFNGNVGTIDDLFYYGVFCPTITYANHDWYEMLSETNMEIPPQLSSSCSTENERINYVDTIIDEIIKGEIEKPEWMTFIEMEETFCETCNFSPSTFLRLIPKDEKYRKLGDYILEFLYSPNRTTVIY